MARSNAVADQRRTGLRPSQGQGYENVKDSHDGDRYDEEHKRIDLEHELHPRQPLERNVTDKRVGERFVGVWIVQVVVGTCVDRVRQRGDGGDQPDGDDRLDGSGETRQRLCAQRVTDGDITLDGKRRDRQDGRR